MLVYLSSIFDLVKILSILLHFIVINLFSLLERYVNLMFKDLRKFISSLVGLELKTISKSAI